MYNKKWTISVNIIDFTGFYGNPKHFPWCTHAFLFRRKRIAEMYDCTQHSRANCNTAALDEKIDWVPTDFDHDGQLNAISLAAQLNQSTRLVEIITNPLKLSRRKWLFGASFWPIWHSKQFLANLFSTFPKLQFCFEKVIVTSIVRSAKESPKRQQKSESEVLCRQSYKVTWIWRCSTAIRPSFGGIWRLKMLNNVWCLWRCWAISFRHHPSVKSLINLQRKMQLHLQRGLHWGLQAYAKRRWFSAIKITRCRK